MVKYILTKIWKPGRVGRGHDVRFVFWRQLQNKCSIKINWAIHFSDLSGLKCMLLTYEVSVLTLHCMFAVGGKWSFFTESLSSSVSRLKRGKLSCKTMMKGKRWVEYFCHNAVMKCLPLNSFQSIDFSQKINIQKKRNIYHALRK